MRLKPPSDYNVSIIEILDGFLKKDWEPYRKYYEKLQFCDLVYVQMKFVEIYDRVHGKMPINDVSFNQTKIYEAFQAVFETVGFPVTILELGAWNGRLAKSIFEVYGQRIMKWHGCDIAPVVVLNRQCKHPLYNPVLLLSHFWDVNIPKHDVFICSHTLEHMTFDQVKKVLLHQHGKYLVLETPIENWDNYEGGHILDVSQEEYLNFIKSLGYENIYSSEESLVTAWRK